MSAAEMPCTVTAALTGVTWLISLYCRFSRRVSFWPPFTPRLGMDTRSLQHGINTSAFACCATCQHLHGCNMYQRRGSLNEAHELREGREHSRGVRTSSCAVGRSDSSDSRLDDTHSSNRLSPVHADVLD